MLLNIKPSEHIRPVGLTDAVTEVVQSNSGGYALEAIVVQWLPMVVVVVVNYVEMVTKVATMAFRERESVDSWRLPCGYLVVAIISGSTVATLAGSLGCCDLKVDLESTTRRALIHMVNPQQLLSELPSIPSTSRLAVSDDEELYLVNVNLD
ncbi:hypothetical protein U1Q18_032732 [Sarracenia purpurea var. burkii]